MTATDPQPRTVPAIDSQTPSGQEKVAQLYEQFSRYAARLMVVYEAGRIVRSTTDPEKLAAELLKAIAEPLFAGSGCVARLHDGELKVIATLALSDQEVASLVSDVGEATVWFEVADGDRARSRSDLMADGEPTPPPRFEIYVPLRTEDRQLGVLALGPRVDGQPYAAEDVQFTDSLALHLALAVDHAELLAEQARRIEQLSVLLRISKEITSTLDIDRVLATIARMTALVVPNRRTVVALAHGGGVEIRATSDPAFDPKGAASDPLLDVMRWARAAGQDINTCRWEVEASPELPGHDLLLPLLSREGGSRGIAILPLEDDQGVLGLLGIETAEDTRPLGQEASELITILANQTTVALRNAELYQRIPMAGLLGSLRGKSRAAERGALRRWAWPLAAVALIGGGILVPLPAWVAGDATIRPSRPIALRAATSGILDEILVVEGDQVAQGAVIARLRRDELEVSRERARASIQKARAEAGGARDRGDRAAFTALQAEEEKYVEELRFLQAEITRTEIVAPVTGVVLTSWVELKRGERLARGDTLLDLADLSQMEIEVQVAEEEVGDLAVGGAARLKVHAYPRRTFEGTVDRIAPRAGEGSVFRVLVKVDNADGALRPGMTGRAHLDVPWRPPLRTAFRPLLRWARVKFWI